MLTIVAAALSGLLWLTGTGLHPVPALTWLAPLPLLLLSSRVRPRTVLIAAVAAWVIGQLGVLRYYLGTLQIPAPAVAGVVLLGAALAAGTVLLARALLRRGRTVTAVLAVPSLWVLGEYAASVLLPHGAWWSLAYTQAGVRPVIQVTALTGVWGVTYLLLAVPIALSALLSAPRKAVVCLLALAVTVGGWSAWSLTHVPSSPEVAVGLVALEQTDDGLPLDKPEGQELLGRYVPRVADLVRRGAKIVVLPEKAFGVSDATLPVLVDTFRPYTASGTRLVIGAVLKRADTYSNVALILGPGEQRATYAKQHLIPGLESWLTAGTTDVIVDGHYGVAICKDLDFPGLVRGYRNDGATMMLVPALDFTGDGWLHSRMALVRGVESGLTVVRAAAYGRLTVSDPAGRVLGEASAGNADLLVRVRPGAKVTLYSRTGDWFCLLSLLLLVGAITVAARDVRRGTSVQDRPSAS
jgi:apolipoprotein N-acyltransferase